VQGQNRLIPDPHYAIQDTPPPANTDHVKRKFLDVPYADRSPAQQLDVYLPDEGEGPFPVIVSIHGGAFMGCDKADVQVLPMLEGLKRGYAVVAVNYRLSWEAKFPALVHDVKAAVRWVRANARYYHFDPDRIAAWGGSAGGYLSAMLGVSASVSELEDLRLGDPGQPCDVQAVVVWFGPTDFLKMDERLVEGGMPPQVAMEHNGANSPESLLLGEQITLVPDLVRAANSETYINPAAPPFFLQHGTLDDTVPVQQSIEFASKLEKAIGKDKVILDLLEGAGHADPRFEAPDNVSKVLDFIDKHLKGHGMSELAPTMQ
jgi:acetyl esterase/lipase